MDDEENDEGLERRQADTTTAVDLDELEDLLASPDGLDGAGRTEQDDPGAEPWDGADDGAGLADDSHPVAPPPLPPASRAGAGRGRILLFGAIVVVVAAALAVGLGMALVGTDDADVARRAVGNPDALPAEAVPTAAVDDGEPSNLEETEPVQLDMIIINQGESDPGAANPDESDTEGAQDHNAEPSAPPGTP